MTTTETQLIRVGHSPDPDDAFMFYALAKEKVPMRGFRVEHVIEDIESLNQRALKNAELEVTAVSCHAYAYLADQYVVMRAGSSVGDNYGPILVTKAEQGDGQTGRQGEFKPESLKGKKVGIPGKLTTAYLALQLYASDFEPVFIPFDQIFDAVAQGQVDYGLVIHEGQITFNEKGFVKVVDLGQWWYDRHGLPLPLGLDVIRRDLGDATVRSFAALFKDSIEYALANRQPALEYAIEYGRGIKADLNDQFVGMYVNHHTVDFDARCQEGLRRLLTEGFEKGILPKKVDVDFV
ncbi:MAG: ABC transporter substrate-binding protein [Candidatus Omnitrophica bacterium]|nr:ABC transporter substrate-binding protein [Candidatus Omnitrophota bacterium]